MWKVSSLLWDWSFLRKSDNHTWSDNTTSTGTIQFRSNIINMRRNKSTQLFYFENVNFDNSRAVLLKFDLQFPTQSYQENHIIYLSLIYICSMLIGKILTAILMLFPPGTLLLVAMLIHEEDSVPLHKSFRHLHL